MKNILITGAGSYIGNSFEKWVLDERFEGKYQVNTLDMQKPDWKEADFSGYDVVFHVAGIAHADVSKVSEEIKEKYYKVNTELAIETAKKAKESGVSQFIFMSSMIVYGGMEHITKDTVPKPANFYGDSKWQADKGIRGLEDTSFKVVVLRPPMIYGRGSRGNYPALSGLAKKLPFFPNIKNKRSMLYIFNLCEYVRLMVENEECGIFFPQNRAYVNTGELVKTIADVHCHRIWVTRLLAPFAVVGKHVPGKIGNLCRKAFGSSYYDMDMSAYQEEYCVADFKESIRQTEQV